MKNEDSSRSNRLARTQPGQAFLRAFASAVGDAPSRWRRTEEVGGTGLAPIAIFSKKTQSRKRRAAKSAAKSTLNRIVLAWPSLPKSIRRAMVALIDAAMNGT
jgi:hypothetical protein